MNSAVRGHIRRSRSSLSHLWFQTASFLSVHPSQMGSFPANLSFCLLTDKKGIRSQIRLKLVPYLTYFLSAIFFKGQQLSIYLTRSETFIWQSSNYEKTAAQRGYLTWFTPTQPFPVLSLFVLHSQILHLKTTSSFQVHFTTVDFNADMFLVLMVTH